MALQPLIQRCASLEESLGVQLERAIADVMERCNAELHSSMQLLEHRSGIHVERVEGANE